MIGLLYGDPSPALRRRAAVELDRAPLDDPDVAAWSAEADSGPDVRALLGELATTTTPQAVGYLLCRLAHLGYRGPEPAEVVERLFSSQHPEGWWPAGTAGETPARRAGRKKAIAADAPSDGPRFVTMHTVLPLRGIAAAGFATDPRAERAFDWLLGVRHADGSWPAGPKADLGLDGRPSAPEPEYRRLPRGAGCRSSTTGAVACFALHPDRRRSDAARVAVDHLLAREARDASTIGWELSRLVGLERAMGNVTFYVTHDLVFVLDLASRCGVSPDDRRVRDLVAYLEDLRGPYGLWEHPAHPQLSRWLTFDVECSLRRLVDGDWVGIEEPASFTPYRRGRRRS